MRWETIRWYLTRAGIPLGLIVVIGAHILNYGQEEKVMWPFGLGGTILLAGSIIWIREIWPEALKSVSNVQERRTSVRTWYNIMFYVPLIAAFASVVLFLRWLYDPLF